MPRIRTIKPDFWSHPEPPSPWARLLFLAMLNWADDAGIGTANPKELAAFAFPNDDEMDSRRTTVVLREIYRSFNVVFYTVGGRPYYAVENWGDHQKINNPARHYYNPPPDRAETWLYQDECEPYRSPTVDLPEDYGRSGVPEVGNRKLEVVTSGYVESERSVSNAREENERPLDRMGRPSMSLTRQSGNVERPPEPAPPDRGITEEVRAVVHEHVPPAMLHSKPTRRGLYERGQELFNSGADPIDMGKSLDRLVTKMANGEDLYPGHWPHVHSQMMAEQDITPEQRRDGRPLSTSERNFLQLQARKTSQATQKGIDSGS